MKTLINSGVLGSRKADEASRGSWRKLLLAGSMLAGAGCGSVEMDNFVPMPSKKDGPVSDTRRDGGSIRDTAADARRDLANADFKKLSDGTPSDVRSDSRNDFLAADYKVADMVSADACASSGGLLACSNSSSLASGWLALGGTLDLKGGLLPLSTYYQVRFEGVETLSGVTSAHLSILDLCGKVKASLKVSSGASKQVTVDGQVLDVGVENISSGISTKDWGAPGGTVKLTVSVPCNLDSGFPDLKKADSKSVSDFKTKADGKAQSDAKKTEAGQALDAGHGYDAKAGHDSSTKDLAHSDGKTSVDGKPLAKEAGSPDSIATDANSACALSADAAFNGYIVYGTPKTIGGYSFDYLGKSGSDVSIGISCGKTAVASAQVCPMGLTSAITVAADGKKITIVPISANATVVHMSITVGSI